MRGPNPRWYGVPLMYLISNLFLPNTSVYMRLKPDRIQIVMMSFPSYMGSCRLQIVQEEGVLLGKKVRLKKEIESAVMK